MADHDQKRACFLSAAANSDCAPVPGNNTKAENASASSRFRDEIVGLLPELRAFSRFLSHDRVRADDLVQEAVMRALASRAQFDPSTNLKAWTFTILRNLFYEQGRRRKREQAVLEQYGSGTRMNASPDADSYQVSDLDSMLWQLSPLLREALMLVGAQEMSYDEAAVICGVAVGTMKARVSRARAALIAIRDCAVKDN